MSSSAADPAPVEPAPKRAMFLVFLVVFIDLLGFGIVLPLMPRIAEQYLHGYDDTARGVIIGLLYSSFSIMQFVFSPMWGRMSDRIGRRPVLLVGLGGSVAFYALFGYACTLPAEQSTFALVLLLLSRVGAGIAGATISTAAAVIADCTTPERRAKGMALIGAAFGIGFTFGPLIAWAGYELAPGQLWGAGAIASGLSAIALLLAFLRLPETLRPGPKPPREFFNLRRTQEVLRMPTIGALVLIYFLAIFGFANFEGTLSLFTKEAFQLDDRANYLVFAYIGFVLMIAQGGIYRPLAGRRSEEYLLKLGVGLMILGLGGLVAVAYGTSLLAPPASTSLITLFYLSVTVAVFGFAFVNPSVSALVSKRSDPTRQGEVLGVNQSFSALGRILGPFVGNVAFGLHDSRALPYAIATALLLGVVVLLPTIREEKDVHHKDTKVTQSDTKEE